MTDGVSKEATGLCEDESVIYWEMIQDKTDNGGRQSEYATA